MVQITKEKIKDDAVVEILAKRFNVILNLVFLEMNWSPFSKKKKYIMIVDGHQDQIRLFNTAFNLIDTKKQKAK
jgi:hypothetical protein